MMRKFAPFSAPFLLLAVLTIPSAHSQNNQAAPLSAVPPKILNIVREQLIPGKGAAYAELLIRIAHQYREKKIPVYWLGGPSLSGPQGAIYLNFFESFAEAQRVNDALHKRVAAIPELGPIEEQLLSFTSAVSNALAVRRDDLGYDWKAIDFSKARVLRVATIVVRQGHEAEFREAMGGLGAAYAKLDAHAPWVTYQVTAGAPSSTFVIFLPMRSLDEMDDYIARLAELPQAEGPAVAERLQQIARQAYISWDSELFVVSASTSHVSDDFASGDPAFWHPAQH